jgi:hypothetical protein
MGTTSSIFVACPRRRGTHGQDGHATLHAIALGLLAAMLFAEAAGAEVGVTLTPIPAADPSVFPYRAAELTIDNATGTAVIRAAALRSQEGGPRLVFPVTVAPGTRQSIRVALPALGPEQEYACTLRGESGPVASRAAPISWPIELVNREDFIDREAYRPVEADLPSWPASLRTNVFLAAVLTSLAAVGVLLIPKAAVRLPAVLLLAAAGATAVWLVVAPEPVVIERTAPWPQAAAATTAARTGEMKIVSCRRTVAWTTRAAVAPVYYDERQLQRDTMEIELGKSASIPLQPREVRILRPLGGP